MAVGLIALGCYVGTGDGSGAAAPLTSTSMAISPPSSAVARPTVSSRWERDPETGLRWVELSTLPRQTLQTVALIEAGGPYPYVKDGATFGNRERILPTQRTGFDREYTVPTPPGGGPRRPADRHRG